MAASFAALIRNETGNEVTTEKGRRGQFEIVIDGRTVVSRRGGLIAKIVQRPWPDDVDVLSAIRAAAAAD